VRLSRPLIWLSAHQSQIGDRECHRLPHANRQGGERPAAPQSMAAGRSAGGAGFRPGRSCRTQGPWTVTTDPDTSANSIEVTPSGYVGAADPRTRGALAAGN
jgi:hypothetical protein